MADDIAITAGSGTTVATDERTIAAVTKHVQRVDEQGSTAIAADDVSVTTTSGSAIAARDTRKQVVILASGDNTADIYVGPSGVDAATPANGFRLRPGASVTLRTTAAIHADAVSGTQTLYYIESYDS